jgi:hypothetical protein
MVTLPPYFVLQTLLGGKPDRNRRTIHASWDREVCTFNYGMAPWTERDEIELNACLNALLKLKE